MVKIGGILFVIVNFVFDSILLTWLFILLYSITHLGNHTTQHLSQDYFYYVGFGLNGGIALLALMPFSHHLIKLFTNSRTLLVNEQNKIRPLLNEVLQQAQIQGKLLQEPTVLISDKKLAYAKALGTTTIIFTSGLLNSDGEELKAVLAQQLGYIYHKGGVVLLTVMFTSGIMYILQYLYKVYHLIGSSIAKILGTGSIVWYLLDLVLIIFFSPIIILNWVRVQLINLGFVLVFNRYDYLADKFACDIGYRIGLISYLDKLRMLHKPKANFSGQVLAKQTSPIKRIRKLENISSPQN